MALFIIDTPDFHRDDLFDSWRPARQMCPKMRLRPHPRRHPRHCARVAPKKDDAFQVCMDVQQFAPEEITVKTLEREVVVEAKHEEKEDEHGTVYRRFVRRYTLPEGYRPEDVVSTLSSDGVLSVSAPKHVESSKGEKVIPITITGPAHTVLKDAPKDKQDEDPQRMDV